MCVCVCVCVLLCTWWTDTQPYKYSRRNSDRKRLKNVTTKVTRSCPFTPGTLKERGISLEDISDGKSDEKSTPEDNNDDEDDEEEFVEGPEVYDLPWLPDCVQKSSLAKVFRIFPGPDAIPLVNKDLHQA